MNNRATGWIYKCEAKNPLLYWDMFCNTLVVRVPSRTKMDLPYFCGCETQRVQLTRKPLHTRKRKNNCKPVKIELKVRRLIYEKS